MRNTIIKLLEDTGRSGIDELIKCMDDSGFFTSPCSGAHHLSKKGGLAEHSLNVYYAMMDINKALKAKLPQDSIIICALLHDLGKMGDYGKPNYVENLLKSGKVSDSKPYKTNPNLLYVPHEIRSVVIAQRKIKLTEAEEFAILYHNGMYSDLRYSFKGHETPMALALHFADMWCSRVNEAEEEAEE